MEGDAKLKYTHSHNGRDLNILHITAGRGGAGVEAKQLAEAAAENSFAPLNSNIGLL